MKISKRILITLLCISLTVAAMPIMSPQTVAGPIVITLDPGHGGADVGAVGVDGTTESALNWAITLACKAKLEQYGCTVYLTRGQSDCPSLYNRCYTAAQNGSAGLVSIHNNSATAAARGAEVWVPNSGYRPAMAATSAGIGQKIVDSLASYGFTNRGVKTRAGSGSYPDGSTSDYYSIIYNSKTLGLGFGMIVECGFVSNSSDLAMLKNTTAVGEAIANGIAQYYGMNMGTYLCTVDEPTSHAANPNNSAAPASYIKYKGTDNSLYVKGWSVHSDGIRGYQASLNGGAWVDMRAYYRDDVAAAHPGFSNCAANAYDMTFDVFSWGFGVNTLVIQGVTASWSTYVIATIKIDIRSEYESAIDIPGSETGSGATMAIAHNVADTASVLPVSGWSVHRDGVASYRYIVDTSSETVALNGSFRSDVAQAYSAFAAANSTLNAFSGDIPITGLALGEHRIVIQAVTKTGKTYDVVHIYMTIRTGTSLTVNQTYFGMNEDILVTATAGDGDWVGMYKEGDVPSTHSAFYYYRVTGGDRHSGETLNLRTLSMHENRVSAYTPGTYYVRLFDSSGNQLESVTIYITTYRNTIDGAGVYTADDAPAAASFDLTYPQTPVFNITGWSVHTNALSSFTYRIDASAPQPLESYCREDVKNAMQGGYPAAAGINAYSGSIPLSSVGYGTHTVEVTATASNGYSYTVAVYTLDVQGRVEITAKENSGITIERTDETAYVKGVEVKTHAKELNDKLNQSCTVYAPDGEPVEEYIGTGSVVRYSEDGYVLDEVTVIVTGDSTGDGITNGKDILRAKKLALAPQEQSIYYTASDTNGDGAVDSADFRALTLAAKVN